jgi:hypothetical protein
VIRPQLEGVVERPDQLCLTKLESVCGGLRVFGGGLALVERGLLRVLVRSPLLLQVLILEHVDFVVLRRRGLRC